MYQRIILFAVLTLVSGCRSYDKSGSADNVIPDHVSQYPTAVESVDSLIPHPAVRSLAVSIRSLPDNRFPKPITTNVLLRWDMPVWKETPGGVFKVYHSDNLIAPVRSWPWLTNVPINSRSVRVESLKSQEFFFVTGSNHLGEFYATK